MAELCDTYADPFHINIGPFGCTLNFMLSGPTPPAPASFDQRVIDVGAMGQDHIGNGAPVLILAEGLERHRFTEH